VPKVEYFYRHHWPRANRKRWASHSKSKASNKKEPDMKTQEFHIKGMHCESCAATIKQALESTAGVQNANVTFSGKTANVQYYEDVVKPETLLKKIQDVGYNATVGDMAASR
jgi:copper chaperone CopZ